MIKDSSETLTLSWVKLMHRLGYDVYGAHGNDAGALVTPELAILDAKHMISVHLTGGLGITMGDPSELEGASDEELAEMTRLAELFAGGSGYAPYLSNRQLRTARFAGRRACLPYRAL